MSITLQWDNNEHTILRVTYPPTWTWDEFYQINAVEIPNLIKETPNGVYLLADFTSASHLPSNALLHGRSVMGNYPPNWKKLIVVTESRLIKKLGELVHQMFYGGISAKVHTVNSFEEAYKIIEQASQAEA